MMATLTKEQKEIIETKRQVALQRRNERQRLQSQHSSCTNTNSSSSKSLNARGGLPASHSQQVSSNTSCIKDNSFGVKPSSKQKHDFRQFVHHKNTSLSTGEVVTGNCQLISKERFTVTVPYHEQLIDIFNSIDSRNYGRLHLCLIFCRELVRWCVVLAYLSLFLQIGWKVIGQVLVGCKEGSVQKWIFCSIYIWSMLIFPEHNVRS